MTDLHASDNETKTGYETATPQGATESGHLLARILGVLDSRRRRYVLYYLNETDTEVVNLVDLVVYVRDIEARTDLPPTDNDTIGVALHHVHLPRLADAGIIEYDSRSETVRCRTQHPSLALLNLVKSGSSLWADGPTTNKDAHTHDY